MAQIFKRSVLTVAGSEEPQQAAAYERELPISRSAEEELRELKAQLAALREQAKTEGFQQGFASGQNQARAQQHVMQNRWDQVTTAIAQARSNAILQDEAAVIGLTLEVCARILGSAVDVRESAVEIVRAAVRQYQADTIVRILISQQDFDFLSENGIKLDGNVDIKVEPSSKVQYGGCIIETSSGFVDARSETQLERLIEVFRSARLGALSDV